MHKLLQDPSIVPGTWHTLIYINSILNLKVILRVVYNIQSIVLMNAIYWYFGCIDWFHHNKEMNVQKVDVTEKYSFSFVPLWNSHMIILWQAKKHADVPCHKKAATSPKREPNAADATIEIPFNCSQKQIYPRANVILSSNNVWFWDSLQRV